MHYNKIDGTEIVGKGLYIDTVNIILNEDLPQFIDFILKYQEIREIRKLIKLCKRALEENKEIVCLLNDKNPGADRPPRSLLRLREKIVN